MTVPPGVASLEAKRIVVAWNEARECRRALRDALPLLREAKDVFVIEASDKGSESQAQKAVDDVCEYLVRHQITIAAKSVAPDDCRCRIDPRNAQSLADTPSVGIALHSETRHQCNQLQIAPEETTSCQRSAYAEAPTSGQSPQELDPDGKAADELNRLFIFTCELVNTRQGTQVLSILTRREAELNRLFDFTCELVKTGSGRF